MLLTQKSKGSRSIGDDASEFRGDFSCCDLPGQEIHHDTVIRIAKRRTGHTQAWAPEQAKQKAIAARQRVGKIMSNGSELIELHHRQMQAADNALSNAETAVRQRQARCTLRALGCPGGGLNPRPGTAAIAPARP